MRVHGRAMEAVARHQHQAADAGRGRGAAGFADARDRHGRRLRLARAPFQHADVGHVGIEQIERGRVVRQQRRIGEAGEAVVGRGARHGHRALGQRRKAVAVEIVGRDHRLLPADEDAQPEIVAFGALRFLDGAVAHLDRQRHAAHGDRVGLVGAGALGGGDDPFGDVGEGGLVEERWHWLAIGVCGGEN